MSIYDTSLALRVTVVDGSTFVGRYAPNGSLNVQEAPGTSPVGALAPCGALYVTVALSPPQSIYAPDGSIYVSETPSGGALHVEVTSGSFGSTGSRIALESADFVLMESGDYVLLEG